MDIILRWTKMSVMTVRSAGWGREDFISATDSFNAKSVATLLRAFPELSSFRALGISGFDISPECVLNPFHRDLEADDFRSQWTIASRFHPHRESPQARIAPHRRLLATRIHPSFLPHQTAHHAPRHRRGHRNRMVRTARTHPHPHDARLSLPPTSRRSHLRRFDISPVQQGSPAESQATRTGSGWRDTVLVGSVRQYPESRSTGIRIE